MTRLLVLGLLDLKPLSGYDIQQTLKQTDAERWGDVLVGSIYHALKTLEAEEFVEVTSVEQTGHRQKVIYQITEKGREHLKELIIDSLKASSVLYPITLYSGLSYLHKLPKEEALTALTLQANALNQEYRTLEKSLIAESAAMAGVLPDMTKLVFKNMFAIIRQQQDFVAKAVQMLNSQG